MANSQKGMTARKGFTLIELLIVIGIIGIIASIVLVAVDPAKRLRDARDARRFAEVNSLLNAILNYQVDNSGTTPAAIASATAVMLGTSTTQCGLYQLSLGCDALVHAGPTAPIQTPIACADLTADLVDKYIAQIPIDPKGSSASGTPFDATRTGYYLQKSSNGRITIGSCNAEGTTTAPSGISVKR